jgi:hypothetical protein
MKGKEQHREAKKRTLCVVTRRRTKFSSMISSVNPRPSRSSMSCTVLVACIPLTEEGASFVLDEEEEEDEEEDSLPLCNRRNISSRSALFVSLNNNARWLQRD